ncbi:C40 family peptidase [Chlamydia sp. 17-3921]|uniref:C40 family peptidase n=1 Tax=Chlamydia sp. 17-3921 TaxID=2675798 RepID=UPI00191A9950|nr:NlpC/P60 family protein [Chlamydia sp. 17-3921]
MQRYQLYSPVADLFSETGGLETQLLFGERVLYKCGRYYACSQLIKDGDFWRPYPGNLFSKQVSPCTFPTNYHPNAAVISFSATLDPWNIPLPFGSLLTLDSDHRLLLPSTVSNCLSKFFGIEKPSCNPLHVRRFEEKISIKNLLQDAERFLNRPYLWGGRSLHNNLFSSGVDCSGFINLLYQSQGLSIPRNAQDQYLDCIPVKKFEDLPIGGLVFLQTQGESHMSHVLLKKDSQSLLHSSESVGKVNLYVVGKDFELFGNRFYSLAYRNKKQTAYFGIPKRRKAFL